MNGLDRVISVFSPAWALKRSAMRRALSATRNYEAASRSRRTSGWARNFGDADAVMRTAIPELRLHARDLVRNNGWARNAQRTIANNTAGWGIVPKATGPQAEKARELWRAWADTTQCDADGRKTFAGIQHLAMRSLVESGEVLIRRRPRRPTDGLAIPLQLQVLEADFLDTSKDGLEGTAGGPIRLGVEFDALGKRVAYWLFDGHPGGQYSSGVSRRIPASEILHIFYEERPGSVRGVSWLAAAVAPLKDLDECEDAELLKQKIAACMAVFVGDSQGAGAPIGEEDSDDPELETLEPGMISYLPDGKTVTVANPPQVISDPFVARTLRKIAKSLGVTYEDLTGDYSNVNYSSARMARLAHWSNVHDWQFNLLIPLLCNGVWAWAMEAAFLTASAEWTAPPMPMIEPDREGLAYSRLIRNGVMTYSEMVNERGGDFAAHFEQYAADQKVLDSLKIKLDSDVRAVSAAGLTQEHAGGTPGGKPPTEEADDEESARAFGEFLVRLSGGQR